MEWILIGIILLITALILVVRYNANGGLFRRYCTHIKTSLNGKTVVITGGNAGIGHETAADLARRGARVILACRNEEKAKGALQTIQKKSGSSNVVYYHLDLSDLDSVRNFADKFLREEERLDILINNAGVGRSYGRQTKQGYDLTFGTNHLGHFLLTLLLLDRLKKCAPSRVVTVSSMAHIKVSEADIHFRPGDGELKYPGLVGYDRSKLANIMFTKILAERLKDSGVTAYSLHPGFVSTSIFQQSYELGSPWWRYLLYSSASRVFGYNEEAGAQPSIYCAVEESITKYSGRYFDNCMLGKLSKLAQDDGVAKKLWDISCKITGVDY
ncbi:retinol dehydrogenase 12-like [Amphiura filiformis]|uniref:retinol dehydrogenase 12-like n=1 Tax=Amphiura filiformis TaxID=82378 RepID=UPI003B210774